jgi:uncharacterized protein with von Willebrand factor type A (vWA) domain
LGQMLAKTRQVERNFVFHFGGRINGVTGLVESDRLLNLISNVQQDLQHVRYLGFEDRVDLRHTDE